MVSSGLACPWSAWLCSSCSSMLITMVVMVILVVIVSITGVSFCGHRCAECITCSVALSISGKESVRATYSAWISEAPSSSIERVVASYGPAVGSSHGFTNQHPLIVESVKLHFQCMVWRTQCSWCSFGPWIRVSLQPKALRPRKPW